MDERFKIIIEMTLIEDEATVKSVKDSQRFGGKLFPDCIAWNISSALRSLLVGYSPDDFAKVVQELSDNIAEQDGVAIEPPHASGQEDELETQ